MQCCHGSDIPLCLPYSTVRSKTRVPPTLKRRGLYKGVTHCGSPYSRLPHESFDTSYYFASSILYVIRKLFHISSISIYSKCSLHFILTQNWRTQFILKISQEECITSNIPSELETTERKNGPLCFLVPDPDHFFPLLLQNPLFFQGSQCLSVPLSPSYYYILTSCQSFDSFSFIKNFTSVFPYAYLSVTLSSFNICV